MTVGSDLSAIAEALSISSGEEVLEIGPGTGLLTRVLLQKGARVLAVEKDAVLAEFLKHRFGVETQNFASLQVITKDILRVDLQKDLNLKAPIKIAGNIPYNITSPIVEWLILQRKHVSEAVLTVQWEVARRLAAGPGNKDWGSLSIFLQFYADVKFLRKIDKSHFRPMPKVDSGVIRICFLPEGRFPVGSELFFFGLVRRAFQKRRKTILNALEVKNDENLSKEALLSAFSRLNIDSRRRPETLSISEWAALSRLLCGAGQK